MKRLVYFLSILSILMFACSLPTTVTPNQPPATTEPPLVTEPPPVTEQPKVTELPAPATNVVCNELALYLDPLLASSYSCETIPESAEGVEVYPQYTNLTLQGYVLSDKFFTPHISVFPIQHYTELLPDFVPGRISELQALIGGGATGDSLPFLPVFNAGQIFHAQYQVAPFASGNGIRFLTLYAQYTAPINNRDLFYTYQGLTSDGLRWVSVIMPINNLILPDNGNNPPGGVSWEEFSNNYPSYLTNVISQLNSQAGDNYTPTITLLDALVASITIQP